MGSGVAERVESLMAKNTVRLPGASYTKPSQRVYEEQWLWDSCFHAIINSHLNLELAEQEIRAVLAHQVQDGPDAGMIPHMTYWRGGGTELWGVDDRSTITQPPMVAYAVREIFRRGGEHGGSEGSAFAREAYGPLKAYYDWFYARRDADKDRLVTIIHPWESGWDNSIRWDELMGFTDDTSNRYKRAALVGELERLGYDEVAIAKAGLFAVEAVDFNAILAENLTALSDLAGVLGHPDDQSFYERRGEEVREAINRKCWDEEAGFYFDLNLARGRDEDRNKNRICVKTPAAFVTLFAGIPDAGRAERLVLEMSRPEEFWTTYPLPTVARSDPAFSHDRYWRGTTWVNINWFVIKGLRRYGYEALAGELTRRTLDLVEAHGFWEYYNPDTGQGLGAKELSWSGLILDLV